MFIYLFFARHSNVLGVFFTKIYPPKCLINCVLQISNIFLEKKLPKYLASMLLFRNFASSNKEK